MWIGRPPASRATRRTRPVEVRQPANPHGGTSNSPTVSSDYVSTLACVNDAAAVAVGTNNSITVAYGEEVVCTFTNTREAGHPRTGEGLVRHGRQRHPQHRNVLGWLP